MGSSMWTRRKMLRDGGLAVLGAAGGLGTALRGGWPAGALPTAQAAAGTPVKGGTLKVAQVGDPPTLDIMASTADVVTNDTQGIFEGFFALDSSGNAQPMLAAGAQWSNGNLTLTLPLRTNVLFHSGAPMTAADAAASLQRWLKLAPLGQSSASAVKSITAKDAHTVVIELSRPLGLLPTYLASANAMAAVMPKAILDKYGDKPVQEYIGTGPYMFKEWKPDAYLRLVRWDKYVPVRQPGSGYAGQRMAYADQIDILPVPDANTRLAGMQSGQYDIAFSVPPDQYAQVKSISSLHVAFLKPSEWFIFNLNKKARMFTDLKMRQAFRKAIDSKPIMEAAFGPQEFWSIASPTIGYLAYEDDKTGADVFNHQDIPGAKALLQEAGYKGQPLVWLTTKNYDYMYKGSTVAKAQLEAVGFKVDQQVLDWATVVQRRAQPDVYDVFQTGMGGAPAIPPAMDAFVSDGWPGWWTDPKKAAAMEKFEGSVSLADRKAAWSSIQQLFYDEVVAVKVGDFYDYFVIQNRVQGFTAVDYPPYWNLWLAS
ncbi:MAG TPA: ABC transporter substrate-binding protein [bacterium]|nr:ABC transporter substrate-binding protein [bacterium]